MIGRLGSHWRWRLPLLAATLAIGVFAWWLARERASWSFLPGGAGSTVLLVADKGWCKSIIAWEPSSGQRWTVVSQCRPTYVERGYLNIVVARNGRAVCWEEFEKLHVVDVTPPYQRHSWRLPDELPSMAAIVGLSGDERFAVFQQWMPALPPSTMPRHKVSVIDLQTRQIVSQHVFDGFMHPSYFTEGEFETYTNYSPAAMKNPNEPFAARWRLTETGEWELAEDLTAKPLFPFQYVAFEPLGIGSLRRLAEGETLPAPAVPLSFRVVATSPDFKRACAFIYTGDNSLHLLSDSSDKPIPLPLPIGTTFNGNMTSDGRAVVGIDSWGDARVFDSATGKETATLALGSRHRAKLLPAVAALLVVALLWVILAASEQTVGWALFDTLPPPILLAWALPLAVMSRRLNDGLKRTPFDTMSEFISMVLTYALAGGITATVAWYWAYGRGPMLVRWLAGLALLSVAVTPLGGFAWYEASHYIPVAEWSVNFALAVVLASVGAFLTSIGRMRGWVISDKPIDSDPRRFSMAHFLAALVGVSLALAMTRVVLDRLGASIDLLVVALCVEGLLLGTALGSVIHMRKRWQVVVWTTALVAALTAAAAWFTWRQNVGPFVLMLAALHIPSWLALAMPLTLSCWIARRHSWRWERVESGAVVSERVAAITS